jgi:hypothetical protein
LPCLHCTVEKERAETHTLQAIHLHTDRFPEASDLALSAFHDHDVVPVITALAPRVDNLLESRKAILELDTVNQLFELVVTDMAVYANCILSLDEVRGVHETVCELTMRGKNKQPGTVEIKPSDCNPASILERGQAIENRLPASLIMTAHDFAFRLVIHDDMMFLLGAKPFLTDRAAIDLDPVILTDMITELRQPVIDPYSSLPDPLLDLATRAESGIGKHFLQTLTHMRQ